MIRRVPELYLVFAHLALGLAGAALLIDPGAIAGFFYHPRMLALVHLLTLGWISGTLLAACYHAPAIALRTTIEPRVADLWACVFFVGGSLGIVSHFWIGEWSGVGWSGLLVLLATFEVGVRLLIAIAPAPVPRGVKLQLALAFFNLLAAAFIGLLAVLDKYADVLPGHVLTNVAAHAHLALLGWAAMAGLALALALLAARGPAAVPRPGALLALALLLELGTLALAFSLLAGVDPRPAAVLACAAVLAAAAPLWPLLRPRRAAVGGDRVARFALIQSLAYLALGGVLALTIAFAPLVPWRPRVILAYGVVLLLGFLGLLALGLGGLLRAARHIPPAPAASIVLGLWTLAVPLLAAGLAADWLLGLRLGGLLLLAASALPALGARRSLAAS